MTAKHYANLKELAKKTRDLYTDPLFTLVLSGGTSDEHKLVGGFFIGLIDMEKELNKMAERKEVINNAEVPTPAQCE